MPTTTRNATLVQQGTLYVFGSIWVDPSTLVAYPGPVFGSSTQAQRFQLFTDSQVDKTRIVSLTLNLSVVQWLVPVPLLGLVVVDIQNLANAAVFSDPANLPPFPWGALPADWVQFGTVAAAGWSAPNPPATISIPLGTAVSDIVNGTTLYDLSGRCHILEHSDAGGFINLSVMVTTTNGTVLVTPTLVIEELQCFTGIEGHGVEMGRPVEDMKTGLPCHVPDLVEDGYHPGVWTTQDQWDPADPRDEHPTEFPDGEGVWDDDVPA